MRAAEVKGMVKDESQTPLTIFDAIIDRFKAALKAKTDEELANSLGLTRQNISQARKKGEVPPKWYLTAAERSGCSIDWLLTGDNGKMTMVSEEKAKYGAPRFGQASAEEWDILGKAYQIITSNTIYKSALLHNINAFYDALTYRNEIELLKARLLVLERVKSMKDNTGETLDGNRSPKDDGMFGINYK